MASPCQGASERAPGTIVFRATVAQGPSAGGGGEDERRTQKGHLMRDPERTCEVGPGGEFHPVSFTQDNVGADHEDVLVAAGSLGWGVSTRSPLAARRLDAQRFG